MGTTNFDVVQANTFIGDVSLPTDLSVTNLTASATVTAAEVVSSGPVTGTTFLGDKSRIGPLAGAYVTMNVRIPANATTSTSTVESIIMPAGMSAYVVGVSARARTVTSDPQVMVGNTTDTDGYVVLVNLTTVAANLSVTSTGLAHVVAAAGKIVVTVTNDTGDQHGDVNVLLTLLTTANATAAPATLF